MKTTGLTIQEAVQALKEGKAKHAVSETISVTPIFYLKERHRTHELSDEEILGTWSLVDPVITPSPGEVWVLERDNNDNEARFYVLKHGNIAWFRDGAIGTILDQMVDGKNGFKRVYDPKS